MLLQLTDFAVGILGTNPAPVLEQFKIGSAYNYVPQPTDTDIHGTLLFSGLISQPIIVNANVVKYTVAMDTSVGDFDWGEVAFFYQGQLFALATSNTLEEKTKIGVGPGNQVRLDAFLSVVGTNYQMIVDQADSSNQFQMASLSTVDQLPPTNQTTPNAYIISAASSTQTSFLAYTDRVGLWSFDAYAFASGAKATITAADTMSVTIAFSEFTAGMNPAYFGQVILQFITGKNYSINRYVASAVQAGSSVVLGFNAPLAVLPAVGDKVEVYTRVAASSQLQIPIATTTVLGGIKIGAGLTATPDGVCSVDPSTLPIASGGTLGVIKVGTTLTIDGTGVLNVNPAGLPVATPGVPGVVKPGTGLDVAPDGTISVDFGDLPIATTAQKGIMQVGAGLSVAAGVVSANLRTVNGLSPDGSGNVTVNTSALGLVNPVVVPNAADLNAYTTTGLFTISSAAISTLTNAPVSTGAATLEVVPLTTGGTGDSVQRFTQDSTMFWRKSTGASWSSWVQVASNAIATTISLGVIKVGPGLNVDVAGLLTPRIATTSATGVVQVGTGLSVDGSGVLSINTSALPIATTAQKGIMQVGDGLSVTSGLVSANLRTVNGNLPDGTGNVVVTAPPDNTKLDRVNGVATGIRLFHKDLATIASGGSVPVIQSDANSQSATFTGGAVTWTLTGWPASGTYAEVQIELVNAGLATHTFPGSIRFINPDGTLTSNFTTYIGNQRSGATNFQSSGRDFLILWTRDGGTTVYARVL